MVCLLQSYKGENGSDLVTQPAEFWLAIWAMFTSSGRVSVRREASDGDDREALFTFTDRISVRREVLDGSNRDEGIAEAIAEEGLIARWGLAAGRKLSEKVNKAGLVD